MITGFLAILAVYVAAGLAYAIDGLRFRGADTVYDQAFFLEGLSKREPAALVALALFVGLWPVLFIWTQYAK